MFKVKLYKVNYVVWTDDYGFLNKEMLSIGNDVNDAVNRAKSYVEFSNPSAQNFEAEEIDQLLGHKILINEEDFSIDLE